MTRYFVIIIVLLSLGLWYEHSLWSECLKVFNFFYCLRTISP